MNEFETGVDILDPRFHGDDGLGRFYAPIILHAMVVIKLDIPVKLIYGKLHYIKCVYISQGVFKMSHLSSLFAPLILSATVGVTGVANANTSTNALTPTEDLGTVVKKAANVEDDVQRNIGSAILVFGLSAGIMGGLIGGMSYKRKDLKANAPEANGHAPS